MEKRYTGISPLRIEVENITNLSQAVCEDLNVDDMVVKITNGDKHCYRVSYKKQGVGMCLTYADASRVETISYDCVDGVWTYNSTDVSELGGGLKLYHHRVQVAGKNSDGDDASLLFDLYSTSATSLARTISSGDVGDLYNDFVSTKVVGLFVHHGGAMRSNVSISIETMGKLFVCRLIAIDVSKQNPALETKCVDLSKGTITVTDTITEL